MRPYNGNEVFSPSFNVANVDQWIETEMKLTDVTCIYMDQDTGYMIVEDMNQDAYLCAFPQIRVEEGSIFFTAGYVDKEEEE